MALFLTILKIIGIVLLVILGIVLFILLIVLFTPIRYYATGHIEETDISKDAALLKDRIYVKAGFSYLFHIVRGYIDYPSTPEFVVRILFFKIFPPKKKKKEKEEKQENEVDLPSEMESGFDESSKEDNADTKDNEPENIEITTEETESMPPHETDEFEEDAKEADNAEDSRDTEDLEDAEDTEDTEDTEDKPGIADFVKKILDTVIQIIKVPQDVYTKIKCTISSICAKIDMIKNTLSNDIFKRAFNVAKKQILRVLKMILPRKFKVDLLIGMEDPTVTADIFALYGALYPVLVKKVYVEPSFDRPVLAGTFKIKGKIRVFTILWAAAMLYFNKDVKKTIRRFKKIIES